MLKYLYTALCVGLALISASPAALAVDSDRLILETMFREADIIPDGKLDQGEFDMHHLSAFTQMDINKDGVLDMDECMDNCFITGALNGGQSQVETMQQLEFEDTPYRFKAIDIDGSGALKVYEYILFGRERFKYFDRNKDGTIASDEFCSGYRSSMPCDVSESELLKPQPKQDTAP
ncbi:MAG: EF-hand domain-containing protein [Rhodospirillales bacterium]|nr:EF-hand domain-containing protein [Rhodospirillales bacterium]